jgi:hypothetical protein
MMTGRDDHIASFATGIVTALVLLLASAGKIWSWDRFDLPGGLALIEPWLAVLAVVGHRRRIVRFVFAILFLMFSRYLWWLMANNLEECKCFGNIGLVRPSLILVLDMLLGVVWLWLGLSVSHGNVLVARWQGAK